MELVLDAQFLKNREDEYIVKELAILALDENYVAHWLVKSQGTFFRLPKNVVRQNNFSARYLHGIEWNEGDIDFIDLYRTLAKLSNHVRKVYVRGECKADFVRRYLTPRVVNLEEDENCPTFADLPTLDTYCLFHGRLSNPLRASCALSKADRLKSWIVSTREPVEGPEGGEKKNLCYICDRIHEDEYATSEDASREVHSWTHDGGIRGGLDSEGVDTTDGVHL